MPRASDSIGSISAALAKAQAELTNPEKSLVGTVREPPVTGADAGQSHKASNPGKKLARNDIVRALGKTVRLRDKDHRKFVLRQPCLVCGRVPSDPQYPAPAFCHRPATRGTQRHGTGIVYAFMRENPNRSRRQV